MFGLPLILAALAGAQNVPDADYSRERVILRLNMDLANLAAVPADASSRLFVRCLSGRGAPAPAECSRYHQIVEDLWLVPGRKPRYPHSFSMLTSDLMPLLAGHDLEPGALFALTNSLVDMVAITNESTAVHEHVSSSGPFRDSMIRARNALLGLGVPRRSAEFLLLKFAANAERWSEPPKIEDIPPAYGPPALEPIPPATR